MFYLAGPASVAQRLADACMALDLSGRHLGDALTVKGRAAWLAGDNETARQYLTQAIAAFQEHADTVGLGIANRHLGDLHNRMGEGPEAKAYYDEALRCHVDAGWPHLVAHILRNQGMLASDEGDAEKSIALYERALSMEVDGGNVFGEAVTIGNLGVTYTKLGEIEKARACHSRAYELQQQIGNRRHGAQALSNLANLMLAKDEYELALPRFKECEQTQVEVGDPISAAIATGSIGTCLHRLGRHDDALAAYRKALDAHRTMGFRYGIPHWEAGLAMLWMDANDLDKALEHARAAIESSEPFGPLQVDFYVVLIDVYIARGDHTKAREAIEAAEAHHAPGIRRARVAAVSALLYALQGDNERARAALDIATERDWQRPSMEERIHAVREAMA